MINFDGISHTFETFRSLKTLAIIGIASIEITALMTVATNKFGTAPIKNAGDIIK